MDCVFEMLLCPLSLPFSSLKCLFRIGTAYKHLSWAFFEHPIPSNFFYFTPAGHPIFFGFSPLAEYGFWENHNADGNPVWRYTCQIAEHIEKFSHKSSSKKDAKKDVT